MSQSGSSENHGPSFGELSASGALGGKGGQEVSPQHINGGAAAPAAGGKGMAGGLGGESLVDGALKNKIELCSASMDGALLQGMQGSMEGDIFGVLDEGNLAIAVLPKDSMVPALQSELTAGGGLHHLGAVPQTGANIQGATGLFAPKGGNEMGG